MSKTLTALCFFMMCVTGLAPSCAHAFFEDTGPRAGDVWLEPITGMTFVYVPGGRYEMGCGDWTFDCDKDEKPVHTVSLDGFWLGRTEVTQGQWRALTGRNPAHFKKGDDFPVETVTWYDVEKYIRWLNSRSDATFRLPTEAEWEYACRSAGRTEAFAGGDFPNSVAWFQGHPLQGPYPVAEKAPNALGLFDMSGNVWEWVLDRHSNRAYERHQPHNPLYETRLAGFVRRGGAWHSDADDIRCGRRSVRSPTFASNDMGFRLVREP